MSAHDATTAPLLGEPLPIELMNTIWADRHGRYDALDSAAGVEAWLTSVDDRLAGEHVVGRGGRPSSATLSRELRQLRNALRALAAIATDDDRPAAASAITDRTAAIDRLNRTAASAPTWLQLTWPDAGVARTTVHSDRTRTDVALASMARQGMQLFAGPDRAELRACHGPGCVLYFLRDHPRREWCSAGCGNRARAARHYRRHRAGTAE
jgi:predicted RNA-binding Zn ribbon-like protein